MRPRGILVLKHYEIIVDFFNWGIDSDIPMGVSSCSLSCPILPEVPSAGALSWLGSATPPNVSDICARGSEPAMRTLSRAQSLWSAPSCCGCHQRTRTPSWRAAGGSSTFTNLNIRHTKIHKESYRQSCFIFTQLCASYVHMLSVKKKKKLTQALCTDHRRSLSGGASWFLHSNCTPEAHPGYGCWVGSCSRTWSRIGWTLRWSGSGQLSPADGCNSVQRHKCSLSQSASKGLRWMAACLSPQHYPSKNKSKSLKHDVIFMTENLSNKYVGQIRVVINLHTA